MEKEQSDKNEKKEEILQDLDKEKENPTKEAVENNPAEKEKIITPEEEIKILQDNFRKPHKFFNGHQLECNVLFR